MQHVRRASVALGPVDERVALLDPEAMLLVDDQQGEGGEADVLLQECVRADRDAGLAARQARERLTTLLRGQRGRHQLHGGELPDQARRGLGVLHGQRLGRRDQHALQARLGGAHEAVEGDDGLARAHVALQQPAHRRGLAQIGLQLVEGFQLVARQLERQPVEKGAADVARSGQSRGAQALLLLRLVQQQPDLHQQQLLEHEPISGPPGLGERARQVDGQDRVGPGRQSVARQEAGRQRVGQPAHHRGHVVHEAAEQFGGDLLAGGIHRHDALGVDPLSVLLAEDLVTLHHERLAAALRPEGAAEAEPHPLVQDLDEVALVEPHGLHGSGVVAHEHADDVDAAAGSAVGRHADHLTADGGLLPDLELADALAVTEVLVPAREVLDEVAHGREAEAGEPARHRRRHVFELRERTGERSGVEGEAGDRRPFVVPTTAEAKRRRLPDHSTIIANAAVPGPMCVPTTAPQWPWNT